MCILHIYIMLDVGSMSFGLTRKIDCSLCELGRVFWLAERQHECIHVHAGLQKWLLV